MCAVRPHSATPEHPAELGAIPSPDGMVPTALAARRLLLGFEGAACGLVVWDGSGRFLHANQAYLKLTGHTPDQLQHTTAASLLEPEDQAPFLAQLRRLQEQRHGSFELESRLVARTAGQRWIRQQIFAHYAAPDQSGQLLGIVTEITEHKLWEESTRRFEMLAQHSRDIVLFMRHHDGKLLEVNAAATEAYGYTREEMLQLRIHDLRADSTADLVAHQMGTASAEGILFETVHRRKDGTVFPVEVSSQGASVGTSRTLVSVIRDISKRKAAEAALRLSEEMFAKAFATNPAAIVLSRLADGRIINVNRTWEEMFGFTRQEIIGQSSMTLAAWPTPADRARWASELRDRRMFRNREQVLLKRDGTAMVTLGSAELLTLSGDEIVLSTWLDITDRKRGEDELNAARRSAEAANQAKDEFLAVLSHELRTPLTPVLATTQMLEADPTLSPEHRELLLMIRRNVELEARLIDDLLDLTRVSRNKLELHPERVDVHDKIMHVLRGCENEIVAKDLVITTEFHARRHAVTADPARFQQIVWNVIKNALKFTPTHGRISIRTSNPEPARIAIDVIDTGIGIAAQTLPNIFSAFEQGGREITRRFGGLGLGLAITKALVEAHGGTIAATSDGPDAGATFTIVLPAIEGPATSSRPPFPAAPGTLKCRILLVEDHADTLRAMTRLLQRLGCTVYPAGNVAQAMEVAAAAAFDVLVSDIGLPDGSGNELMQRLSQRGPVTGIALSGYGMDEDIARTKEAGFAVHLRKPVNIRVLEQTIRQLLGR